MRLLKCVFTILSWPIYVCIILYLAIAAPVLLGWRPVIVLSGSMEPTLQVGSIIYYKQAFFEQIQEGDVITFLAGNEGDMVTHRVVKKQEISRNFVTKGDANETEDPTPVSYEAVVGKATSFCIPYAGVFVSMGRRKSVIAGMAAILILGMLADAAVKRMDVLGKEQRDCEKAKQTGEYSDEKR